MLQSEKSTHTCGWKGMRDVRAQHGWCQLVTRRLQRWAAATLHRVLRPCSWVWCFYSLQCFIFFLFGCYWHLAGRGQRYSRHPKMPRIASHNKEFSGSDVNRVKVGKSWSKRSLQLPLHFLVTEHLTYHPREVPYCRQMAVTSIGAFPA